MIYEENWDDPDSACSGTPVFQNVMNYGCSSFSEESERCNSFPPSDLRGKNWKFNGKKVKDQPRSRREKNFSYNSNDLLMKVESNKIGSIIGRHGSRIKELEEKTGAKIKIGKACEEDYYLTSIRICGKIECQQMCKTMIEDLIKPKVLNYSIQDKPCNSESEIDWDAIIEKATIIEEKKWEQLPPIKKFFYVEDPEVSNLSQQEVREFREKNNNIKVKNLFGENENIPNPIQTFSQAFKNYPEVMTEIEKQGFQTPTPIQCQAWPILMSGRNLIGIAQTGTGKTLAFLLPALIHIDNQETPRCQRLGPNVLILGPTRELVQQIEKEVKKYSYKNIKCVSVYGGGDRMTQIDGIKNGAEIVIATPGRLNDLNNASVVDFKSITYLVLDEADRMLDMGFEPQIRKILLDIRPDRQSVMTSATWGPNVQKLAEKYMNNPAQIYIGSLDLAAVNSVVQTVLVIDENDKKDYLLGILQQLTDNDKIIVFVGKKNIADSLSCDLSLDGILCQCIHGNRDQADREQALDDLKTGRVKILIATDVASRGLDICDITKVLNYDFPSNIEEYVHRVGRTGRAGKTGEAITFFTRGDWAHAGGLISILENTNQGVPEELYQMKERYFRKQQKNDEKTSGQGFNRRSSRY